MDLDKKDHNGMSYKEFCWLPLIYKTYEKRGNGESGYLIYSRGELGINVRWLLIILNQNLPSVILVGRTYVMADKEKYLQYSRLQINLLSRTVYIDNQEIVLTRMEFDVLYYLASNPNIAFTKEQIYEAVSKDNYSGGSYIIRDIVYRLRTKLQITNIQTLHGYGYKFSTDDNEKDNPMS